MTRLNVLMNSHPVYRVLQVLHEGTKSERMYPEEIHQHVPDMVVEDVASILQRLRKRGYVSCNGVYGRPEKGKQFYGITLNGDHAYQELYDLLQSERGASIQLKESEGKMRRKLRQLETIHGETKH
jgi:transcription initiation factor IIE alpha subunit